MYYYKCPKKLGYLEISLDTEGKIQSAIFIDSLNQKKLSPKKYSPELTEIIKNELDAYFLKKKNISSSIISKEIKGTDFQKSIWAIICKVPYGATITYTEMTKRAGNMSAARAAGTACGKNPVALFIPCHRVVRKEGEDYGYSWGPERKKWLLEFESDALNSAL